MGLFCFFDSVTAGRSSRRENYNSRGKRNSHVKQRIEMGQPKPYGQPAHEDDFLNVRVPTPAPPHLKSALPSRGHIQEASRQLRGKPITRERLMAALPRLPLPMDSSVVAPSGGMTTTQILDVIKELDDKLNSSKFKVSGKAAWAVWGYDLHPISHVTIEVPKYARDTTRTWAKMAGMRVYSNDRQKLGVPLPDGSMQQVKIKWLEEKSLDYLGTGNAKAVGYSGSMSQEEVDVLTQSKVLSLPSLLEISAWAWLGDSDLAKPHAEKQQFVARDIFWLLERMLEMDFLERGWPVLPHHLPTVCDDMFWTLFHVSHPQAKALFAQIGLTEDKVVRFQRSKAMHRGNMDAERWRVPLDDSDDVGNPRIFSHSRAPAPIERKKAPRESRPSDGEKLIERLREFDNRQNRPPGGRSSRRRGESFDSHHASLMVLPLNLNER